MLGLCFLILDTIECEEIWADWISKHEENVTITIHSKTKFVHKTDIFRKKAVCIPSIPTRWGDFSLVEATIGLFKESIKNKNVTHCILLSGACIPLKSFSTVYKTLHSNINKSFVCEMDPVEDLRYKKANKRLEFLIINKRIECKKHHQWIIACKKHAELVADKFELIKMIFNNTRFSDETWFLTILMVKSLQHEIIFRHTTYTDWSNAGCHPKLFETITNEELKTLIDNPTYLFGRKFTSSLQNYNNLLE